MVYGLPELSDLGLGRDIRAPKAFKGLKVNIIPTGAKVLIHTIEPMLNLSRSQGVCRCRNSVIVNRECVHQGESSRGLLMADDWKFPDQLLENNMSLI